MYTDTPFTTNRKALAALLAFGVLCFLTTLGDKENGKELIQTELSTKLLKASSVGSGIAIETANPRQTFIFFSEPLNDLETSTSYMQDWIRKDDSVAKAVGNDTIHFYHKGVERSWHIDTIRS